MLECKSDDAEISEVVKYMHKNILAPPDFLC